MKKLHFKNILSATLAICLLLSSSVMCYAYDGNVEETETVVTFNNDEGTPLPISPNNGDDGIVPYSGVIQDLISGTTTGYLSGTFNVPNEYSLHLIRAHWTARATNGANSSAVFKMTVTGNGSTYTVYLDASGSAKAYSIGTLPSGSYSYSIRPYTNVSGTYVYGLQFYAY